ncbi:MAG: IMP cyclohydrolase [Oscillospiraceae bacterium]|jgi:IMP cyclohydrolase|nr:IMP cyclohydrolase [Oscillospiraceae bacterium]
MSELRTIREYLSGVSYPGRGILVGRSVDGLKTWVFYFITARSEQSRNRVLAKAKAGLKKKLLGAKYVLATKAFDESLLKDPHNIIYNAVIRQGDALIVTNGVQTDAVADAHRKKRSLSDALRDFSYEDDKPNYTPRICAVVESDGRYKLSILKNIGVKSLFPGLSVYEYNYPEAGVGQLIHTYASDGDPLPSFEGTPVPISLEQDFEATIEEIWDSLGHDVRVALYAGEVVTKDGKTGFTHTVRNELVNKK